MKITRKLPPETIEKLSAIVFSFANECGNESAFLKSDFQFFCYIENIKAFARYLAKRHFKFENRKEIKIEVDHNVIYSLFIISRTQRGVEIVQLIETYLQTVFNSIFEEAQNNLNNQALIAT